jgi:hypothetical protein
LLLLLVLICDITTDGKVQTYLESIEEVDNEKKKSFTRFLVLMTLIITIGRGGQRAGLGRYRPKTPTRPKPRVKLTSPYQSKLHNRFKRVGFVRVAGGSDGFNGLLNFASIFLKKYFPVVHQIS